jgi:hypothetical protein
MALPAARALRLYCSGLNQLGRYPLQSLTQTLSKYKMLRQELPVCSKQHKNKVCTVGATRNLQGNRHAGKE